MCGICVYLYCHETTCSSAQNEFQTGISGSKLHRRGPDKEMTIETNLCGQVNGTFHGCTLHFRGPLTGQPLRDEARNIFLWNGEVFGGVQVSQLQNDTAILLSLLSKCTDDESVLQILSQLQGPWAFVFWQECSKKLWFGRDIFGRRSLLFRHKHGILGLASLALQPQKCWSELPAVGIYCINLKDSGDLERVSLYPWAVPTASENLPPGVYPWDRCRQFNATLMEGALTLGSVAVITEPVGVITSLKPFNEDVGYLESLPDGTLNSNSSEGVDLVKYSTDRQRALAEELIDLLGDAVARRVECQSHLCSNCVKSGIARTRTFPRCRDERPTSLPGGHLTDTDIARDGDPSSCPRDHVDPSSMVTTTSLGRGETGDYDVRCNAHMVPLSQNGCSITSGGEPDPDFIHPSFFRNCEHNELAHQLEPTPATSGNIDPEVSRDDHVVTGAGWDGRSGDGPPEAASSAYNIDIGRPPTTAGIQTDSVDQGCGHCTVAVSFSGGIDSLVIAALADRYVRESEPIDLFNVAFEQQSRGQTAGSKKSRPAQDQQAARTPADFDVPDRLTGRQGLEQLRKLNPRRSWKFVEINVTKDELQKTRESHVRHLVFPLQTVLDDSIGCAIWFAARGQGVIRDTEGTEHPYLSPARVVLVGMGADEQLVGYSRHRVKFNMEGLKGLVPEIKMEIERISSRNLGRDDRVIADHGRESRLPYLDESVVSFLNTLPLTDKADLRLPRGVGEKLLLRLAAHSLGLGAGALLPKRAIQFGSRIAKAEDRREKGSAVCARLQ